MFWGLNLKANRKYSQTTNKSFHISQAALDSESSDGGSNEIYISCGNQKFLICTLRKEVCEQVMLDFNFAAGDKICFQSKGSGNVTLTGYIVENMDFLNGDEEDSESGEENDVGINSIETKKNKNKRAAAIAAMLAKDSANGNDDDDDDEEDDEDYVAGEDDEDGDQTGVDDEDEEIDEEEDEDEDGLDDDEEGEEEEEGEEDDEDDDDEEADSDDEPVPQPQVKKQKLDKPQKQQNGVAKEAQVTNEKKKQKNKEKKDNQNKQQQQQQQQQKQKQAGGERTLSGGVKIEDIKVGNGPEATNNKRVQVYYEGRLKSNNKVFDSLKTGNGFKFTVGRSEVIKGWDIGLIGMKVGGKRRIVCPPHMGYGARGSPPAIPPNSTLIFEVELKAVN